MSNLNPALMALLVGAGGSVGALGRYYVSVGMAQWLGSDWPFGTMTVNLLGSLTMGVLAALAVRGHIPPMVQAVVLVGFLGAFTTFSTFSLDAVKLFRVQGSTPSVLYVAISVAVGLALAGVGYWATLEWVR